MGGSVETLIDDDAATLRYYPDRRIVHHEFHRFVRGEEFRRVLETGLGLFKRHGATKWLSDDRANGPLTPADGEWATTQWGPRALAAGWKMWAVVTPEKVVAQMNVRRIIDIYSAKGLTVRTFTDPREALRWLSEP
jgi:hypothetical protein